MTLHTHLPNARQTLESRKHIEDAIQRLIDMLDDLDPDPDLEEEPDRESYLAGCLYAAGTLLDLEGDDADLEPNVDDEESLGWPRAFEINGGGCAIERCLRMPRKWCDAEFDDCDDEYSLAGAMSDLEQDTSDYEPEEWDGEPDIEDWRQPVHLVSMEGVA